MLRPTVSPTARMMAVAALALIFIVAAAVGAYAHWILWHPMDGVMVVLAAGVALLAAGVMAIALRGGARRLAVLPLVVGVGLTAGQGLGPSRPDLQHDVGTMTVTLERPRSTTSVAGPATCETVESGSELQVEAASRLDLREDDPTIPADVDQREFVTIGLSVGDRWRDTAIHRSDDVDLDVIVGGVTEEVREVRLGADDTSLMELEWTNDGGSLRFDRLVVDRSDVAATGDPIDLAGTITWTCRLAEPTQAEIEFAEEACADSTFSRCRDDLLLTMRQAPGSLVAICDHADGEGEVVPLEQASDAASLVLGRQRSRFRPSGRCRSSAIAALQQNGRRRPGRHASIEHRETRPSIMTPCRRSPS